MLQVIETASNHTARNDSQLKGESRDQESRSFRQRRRHNYCAPAVFNRRKEVPIAEGYGKLNPSGTIQTLDY